ncbi:MAG: hypothetical protein PWP08_758 [Methanofollis sp.]|nr:hypothetical protein [Methanofollis sp.]
MHRRLMEALPFFVLLLLLIAPSAALTMEVSGDTCGQAVTVALDRDAFISFTLNNATPVYAYGSGVQFIPVQTGTLTISAVCGAEQIEKAVVIGTSGGGDSPGGDGGDSPQWRTVTVSAGTARITTHDSQKTYSVDCLTVLGVLDASGIPYTVTDKDWGGDGLFVDSINGREGVFPAGWMYEINGVLGGPAEFQSVGDGDEIIWYYSRSMSDTPEDSDQCIYLKVRYAGNGGSEDTEQEDEVTSSLQSGPASGRSASILSLPTGASISTAGSARVFTLDTQMATDAGEDIRYDGNVVVITCGAFELSIHLEDLTNENGIISGVIERVTVEAAPLQREVEGVGSVSSSFLAELKAVPDDASIGVTLSGNLSEDLRNALALCALDRSHSVSAIAYVMQVDTGTLTDGADIGTATVVMTVPPGWVETHGGTDAMVILHQRMDGTVEALDTRFAGYEKSENMRFEADSPGGLSIFALAAFQEESVFEDTPSPVQRAPADETGSHAASPSSDMGSWIFYAVCLLLIAGGAGMVYRYMRRKE